MSVRFPDALRALISSFDRVAREVPDLGLNRVANLFIWTYQIDASASVKTKPRLLALVEDGHAQLRRIDSGMTGWRPTPGGRAALKAMDRANDPVRLARRIASGEVAREAAARHALLTDKLLKKLADNQPHRLRKLCVEFGEDVRPIFQELVERGQARPFGTGWLIAGGAAGAANPVPKLPSSAATTAEVMRALAVPRTMPELVTILGKSRQAVWAQLRYFERRGLVKGPPIVNGKRQMLGRWERIVPKSADANQAK